MNKLTSLITPNTPNIILKYILKMITYPLAVVTGYHLIVFIVENNITITFANTFGFSGIILMAMMIYEIVKNTHIYNNENIKSGSNVPPTTMFQLNDPLRKTRAIHEAGHYFIAIYLGVEVDEVHINMSDNSGGKIHYKMPYLCNADEIRKKIWICYAGFLAERLFIDNVSDGSFDGDIKNANELLKQYIMLTEESLSLTGYDDKIKEKSIEFSKKWIVELEKILSDNTDKVHEYADILNECGKIDIPS